MKQIQILLMMSIFLLIPRLIFCEEDANLLKLSNRVMNYGMVSTPINSLLDGSYTTKNIEINPDFFKVSYNFNNLIFAINPLESLNNTISYEDYYSDSFHMSSFGQWLVALGSRINLSVLYYPTNNQQFLAMGFRIPIFWGKARKKLGTNFLNIKNRLTIYNMIRTSNYSLIYSKLKNTNDTDFINSILSIVDTNITNKYSKIMDGSITNDLNEYMDTLFVIMDRDSNQYTNVLTNFVDTKKKCYNSKAINVIVHRLQEYLFSYLSEHYTDEPVKLSNYLINTQNEIEDTFPDIQAQPEDRDGLILTFSGAFSTYGVVTNFSSTDNINFTGDKAALFLDLGYLWNSPSIYVGLQGYCVWKNTNITENKKDLDAGILAKITLYKLNIPNEIRLNGALGYDFISQILFASGSMDVEVVSNSYLTFFVNYNSVTGFQNNQKGLFFGSAVNIAFGDKPVFVFE